MNTQTGRTCMLQQPAISRMENDCAGQTGRDQQQLDPENIETGILGCAHAEQQGACGCSEKSARRGKRYEHAQRPVARHAPEHAEQARIERQNAADQKSDREHMRCVQRRVAPARHTEKRSRATCLKRGEYRVQVPAPRSVDAPWVERIFLVADEDRLRLHQPVFRIRRRFANEADFNAFGEIAVLQPGALVAPWLADFDGPDLALRINGDHTVRIAEFDGFDDARQLDIAAGCPGPAVMGRRIERSGKQPYPCNQCA